LYGLSLNMRVKRSLRSSLIAVITSQVIKLVFIFFCDNNMYILYTQAWWLKMNHKMNYKEYIFLVKYPFTKCFWIHYIITFVLSLVNYLFYWIVKYSTRNILLCLITLVIVNIIIIIIITHIAKLVYQFKIWQENKRITHCNTNDTYIVITL